MRKETLTRNTLTALAAALLFAAVFVACGGASSPTAPEPAQAASPTKSFAHGPGDPSDAGLAVAETSEVARDLGIEKAGGPTVDICHIPPGNTKNRRVMSVGAGAVPAHLAHGDNLYGEEICDDGLDNDCDGASDEGGGCAPPPGPTSIGRWNPELFWLSGNLVLAINGGISEIDGLLDDYGVRPSEMLAAEIYAASESLAMTVDDLHDATGEVFPSLSASERASLMQAFEDLLEILGVLFDKANRVLEPEGRDVWWISLEQTSGGQPVFFGGGGSGTRFSSRTLKTGVVPVEAADVLERVLGLPLSTWSYQWDRESRHLGPMAEDFRAAFGLGRSEKVLWPLDTSGVALAAIQGLSEVVDERERELEDLRRANENLIRRLEALEEALGHNCPKE